MIAGEARRKWGHHAAAHAAHRLILEQHRELRRLLALGLVETCLRSRAGQSAPPALHALVERIRNAFVDHVRDEEAALLPLFGEEPDGPRRAQILREEHGRQRLEIGALQALSTTENGDAFAERFDRLARTFLVDMAEEERALAVAVGLLDERAAEGQSLH